MLEAPLQQCRLLQGVLSTILARHLSPQWRCFAPSACCSSSQQLCRHLSTPKPAPQQLRSTSSAARHLQQVACVTSTPSVQRLPPTVSGYAAWTQYKLPGLTCSQPFSTGAAVGQPQSRQAHDDSGSPSEGGRSAATDGLRPTPGRARPQGPIPVVPPPNQPAAGKQPRGARHNSSSRGHQQHKAQRTSHTAGPEPQQHGVSKDRTRHQQHTRRSKKQLPYAHCQTQEQLLAASSSTADDLTPPQARAALQQLVYITKGQAYAAEPKAGKPPHPTTTSDPPPQLQHSLDGASPPAGPAGASSSMSAAADIITACCRGLETQPMPGEDAALLAYAAAKCGVQDSHVQAAVEQAVVAPGAALSAMDVSRLAVACSLLNWGSPALLSAVVQACSAQLPKLMPAQLISTLRHLSLAGAQLTDLLESAADQLLPAVLKLHSLVAAKLLWVCASQRFHDQVLLDALADRMATNVAQLSPNVLNNTAWACSALQFHHGKLCLELSRLLQQQLRPSTSYSAPTSDAEVPDVAPGAFLSPALACSSRPWTIKQLTHTLFCLTLVRHHPAPLMDAAADHFLQAPARYPPAALAAFGWALAMSRHQRPDAWEVLATSCVERLPVLTIDEVVPLVVPVCAGRAAGPAVGGLLTAAMERLQQEAGMLSLLRLVDVVRALSLWPLQPINNSSSSSSGGRTLQQLKDEVWAPEAAGAAADGFSSTPRSSGDSTANSSRSSSTVGEVQPMAASIHMRKPTLRVLAQEALSRRAVLNLKQAITLHHAMRRVKEEELRSQLAGVVVQLGGSQAELQGDDGFAADWQQRFAMA